ncbi:CrcB protein [Oceanobacillus limi]|uniref:Fluoride-specific ion channel FluC n=1 Tax=Oceanobacillus limi TaxID=930131 RepID=A0A1I0DS98_9BACI|nr:fluoride efflux transporter CrcB [Oceanobacillus limi]SET35287.1 CrcB protein [Oceanobacillus limi]
MSFLLVAIGGFWGSIARYSISVKTNKHFIGTWVANITGSMILAFLFHFYLIGAISNALWLLAGVGFCGAYTTFSTFGNETIQLVTAKNYKKAISYVVSSVVLSITVVGLILTLLGN